METPKPKRPRKKTKAILEFHSACLKRCDACGVCLTTNAEKTIVCTTEECPSNLN